jgi:hypothetical protein
MIAVPALLSYLFRCQAVMSGVVIVRTLHGEVQDYNGTA